MDKYHIFISFYLYLNIYLTIYLFYNKEKKNLKFYTNLAIIWLIPIVGYLYVTFVSIKDKDFWNKVVNYGTIIIFYIAIIAMYLNSQH